MTYSDTLHYLFELEKFGWKLGLERMTALLTELGDPQKSFPGIHIAGSNGKGSVAAMLASIFKASGYRTGLFTSPHLVDARERIRINDRLIPEQHLTTLVQELKPLFEKYGCTFFEALTVLGFVYFARENIDLGVIEVGLGGRFDATNVLAPLLTIITSIALEHTDHLGASLEQISSEKAGILKENIPTLVGWLPTIAINEIKKIGLSKNTPMYLLGENVSYNITATTETGSTFSLSTVPARQFVIPLAGEHQVRNACLAISAVQHITNRFSALSLDSVAKGLFSLQWPGRFQVVSNHPAIILDVAHNPASIGQLVATLGAVYPGKKVLFVFGMLKDKNTEEALKILSSISFRFYLVRPNSDRAEDPARLASRLDSMGAQYVLSDSIEAGIRESLADLSPADVLCITGSHYIVGEALAKIKDLTRKAIFDKL